MECSEHAVEPPAASPPPPDPDTHTVSPSPAWGRCTGHREPTSCFFSAGWHDLLFLNPAGLWGSHLENGSFPLEKCPCHRT